MQSLEELSKEELIKLINKNTKKPIGRPKMTDEEKLKAKEKPRDPAKKPIGRPKMTDEEKLKAKETPRDPAKNPIGRPKKPKEETDKPRSGPGRKAGGTNSGSSKCTWETCNRMTKRGRCWMHTEKVLQGNTQRQREYRARKKLVQ